MALFHRIKVLTSTTGTGSLTLGATGVRDATNGDCLAPAEIASSAGNRIISYWITSGANWAAGNGLLSSDGLTLTRDVNERRWDGAAFTMARLVLAGTSTVFIAARAADMGAGRRGRSMAIARGCASS